MLFKTRQQPPPVIFSNHALPVLLGVLFLLFPSDAFATVLTSDTTWSGEVSLDQDVLVPAGVTLTITPGTRVRVSPAESTKTDPEFLSSLTEITVRGTLIAEGKHKANITFSLAAAARPSWAGIIIDGGRAVLRACAISDAETAISVVHGSLSLAGSSLSRNHYGLLVQGADSSARVEATRIEENDYGVLLLNGAAIDARGTSIRGNRKKDRYAAATAAKPRPEPDYTARAAAPDKSRIYQDDALLGTTVWRGRIEVTGIIRVPENSRLIIIPGTVVEFTRKDTNRDGIGENGLLIQGVLVAKGTREAPIIFRSGEKRRNRGDWDSINIMNSDKSRNLIEHCQIEDAYRGLHFHFSHVFISDAVVRNNYRGIQFQESDVEIRRSVFYGNKSALQARDSDIQFLDNVVSRNHTGMNLLRNSITVRDSVITDNEQEGLRVREGLPIVERNLLDGNRHGLMISDAVYGSFSRNVITRNMESGISLRNTDSIEISGNAVQENGLNGINLQDSSASIQGNLISDNGERGIGVQSFQGIITGNNILKNGLYNLGIDGAADVRAPMNWWGEEDIRRTIFDREDDPSKGSALYEPRPESPVLFPWPLKTVHRNAVWRGRVALPEHVVIRPGARLVVSPGTEVLFSRGSGLTVKGRIVALGEMNAMILFAAAEGKGAGEWDEILLDHAPGSAFSNCIFRNATWALHSHFTDLKVDQSVFMNNYGGMRFTSGPIDVRRSYFGGNDIGIRAYRGTAAFSENAITGNRVGIFVREKGGGLTILKNNLFDNRDYNIRMGDFNNEDVNARDNWWGAADPQTTIYDARVEPGIGTVEYLPFAGTPLAIELPDGVPDLGRMKVD